jgi:hypothetical protein
VPTSIQFYDIQDCLGIDQPNKAIEGLIRATGAAINKLQSLDYSFALTGVGVTSSSLLAAGDDAEVNTCETSPSVKPIHL